MHVKFLKAFLDVVSNKMQKAYIRLCTLLYYSKSFKNFTVCRLLYIKFPENAVSI